MISEDASTGDSRTPAAEPTDSSLFRRIRNGNQDAATQLYFRYAERLRMLARAKSSPDLARRVDADDIVQSVFTSFFRGVGQGYYDVPSGSELWKLFLVIALNKIRAKGVYFRAAKRDLRRTSGGDMLDKCCKSERDVDSPAHAFLKLVIHESLEELPALQAQIITLRIEGYEVAEIAAKTNRSKRTIERILQDFRKKLAGILDE